MIGRTNAISGVNGCTLTVTAPAGVTVTVSKDGKTKTMTADASGTAVFKGLTTGLWAVSISDGTQTSSTTVSITADYSVYVSFNTIPEFTYTGDYQIVNDSDTPITTSQGDWKIRFLTSGTLTFTNLNGAQNGIDVFLVGGGESGGNGGSIWGGGGGSGRTNTVKKVSVNTGTAYIVEIGAGGTARGSAGGTTKFGEYSAAGGGIEEEKNTGGPGGSGGRGGGGTSIPTSNNAAQDGANGDSGKSYNGGEGQGTTTREFGESTGKLYAYGGKLASDSTAATANTGNGGNGTKGLSIASAGGSGIVIIRNAREVA